MHSEVLGPLDSSLHPKAFRVVAELLLQFHFGHEKQGREMQLKL